jgi:predicted NBD/HSP70 family sugar kinase
VNGRVLDGPNAIAGEWGHNPLPWPKDDERPGAACFCGRSGCIETWLSGPSMERDHMNVTGDRVSSPDIARRAVSGDAACLATLERYEERLARALAHVINLLDPDVIVFGGGMSNIERLYANVPRHWGPWIFSDRVDAARAQRARRFQRCARRRVALGRRRIRLAAQVESTVRPTRSKWVEAGNAGPRGPNGDSHVLAQAHIATHGDL